MHRTRWTAFAPPPAALVVLVAAWLGCGCSLSRRPGEPDPNEAVAVVNGQAIHRRLFDEGVRRNLRRYGEGAPELAPAMRARIEQSVLRQLVQEQLVAQKAGDMRVRVTEGELDAVVREHRQRFRSEESFHDYLARANTSVPALREQLHRTLLTDRVIERLGGPIEISKEEVVQHYDDNKERFTNPEQMRLRRLWLPYPADASAAQQQAVRNQAQQLRANAMAGGHQRFEALCRSHSKAAEAARNGDLGLVVPGRFAELDKAVAAGLGVGEVSAPLDDGRGVSLFRIDSRQARTLKPVSEVEGQIRQALSIRSRNERRARVLRDLQAAGKVEIRVALDTGVTDPKAISGPMRPGAAAAPASAPALSSGAP